MAQHNITKEEKAACLTTLKWFKIKGNRADKQITPGQLEIFHALVFKPKNRAIIITATQYGKSEITSIACVVLTCIKNEEVAIIAPSADKAKIIMRYYIDHLGDNPMFYSQLEKDTRLERLRQEESKDRIKLREGGGISIVSAQESNAKKKIEAAMGYGARNVILDEGCLVQDETEATIFRMIAGQGALGFYAKIGNPFHSDPPYTHFYESSKDPKYHKIVIDYEQGLAEKRYTEEFINEARKKPLFDVLYECKFPEGSKADKQSWMSLVSRKEIERAMEDAENMEMFGEKAMGMDPADSGDNECVAVIRGSNLAKIEFASIDADPVNFAGQGVLIAKGYQIKANNIFIDKIGVGAGTVGAMREQSYGVNAVNVAEKALDDKNFDNKKAENYWRMRQWILSGGKLVPDERWYQLANVKYKASDRTGRMQVMSKDEMRRKSLPSPDAAEALMLTFDKPILTFAVSANEKRFYMEMKRKKERAQKLLVRRGSG